MLDNNPSSVLGIDLYGKEFKANFNRFMDNKLVPNEEYYHKGELGGTKPYIDTEIGIQ